MALPNSDQLEGKFDQAKGSIKEGVGNLTGDRQLETEGEVDQAGGEAKEGWGNVKNNISDAIDGIGDAISDAAKKINR